MRLTHPRSSCDHALACTGLPTSVPLWRAPRPKPQSRRMQNLQQNTGQQMRLCSKTKRVQNDILKHYQSNFSLMKNNFPRPRAGHFRYFLISAPVLFKTPTPSQINLIKKAKNNFLLLKKFKNTESAQLCRGRTIPHIPPIYGRLHCTLKIAPHGERLR